MGYRRFTDRDGRTWEVRDLTRAEWRLEPVSGTGDRGLDVPSPGYERDPFELSQEELQRLLDKAQQGPRRSPPKSPFGD